MKAKIIGRVMGVGATLMGSIGIATQGWGARGAENCKLVSI